MNKISLGTNIGSLTAQRRLADSSARLQEISARLSSGMRINSPSDDAAGLSVATSLNATSRIYSVGIRNLNDGISVMSIAEGALGQLSGIVTRQLELAEQAANGSYSLTQRKSMNTEANGLVDEFNRIIESTSFNGTKLLDGSFRNLRIQAGYGVDESLFASIGSKFERNIGTGTFAGITTITVPGGPREVELADLNGDGILDMISGLDTSTDLVIRWGNGDGTFNAGVSYDFSRPYTITLGDIDNNGTIDIIANGGGGGNGNVFVLQSNGNGTFLAPKTFTAVTGGTEGAVLGDFNNDGKLDLVIGNNNNGKIAILMGNGDGTFQSAVSFNAGITGTGLSMALGVGDFNNDGKLDVIYNTSGTGQSISILLGNGNGSFRAQVTLDTTLRGASVGVGDFNNDGFLDFISDGNSGGVALFLGNGDGSFAYSSLTEPGSTSEVRTYDVNSDGILDIVGINRTGNSMFTLLGNGNGTFRMSQSTAVASGTSNFRMGDVNGDGVLDILSTSVSANVANLQIANVTESGKAEYLYLLTQAGALSELDHLRSTLSRITDELGSIGALQSRFGVAKNLLSVTRIGYTSAYSSIMDADIAQESANYTGASILQQIGASILAQANIGPQIALNLLKG